MRTNLKVPFLQRLEAKRLGARWDPARRVWFCPDGVDLTPLLRWVPASELQAARKAQARLVFLEKRKARSGGVQHRGRRPSADELRALIERDRVLAEESCIQPNPEQVDTYYERVNGGPWVRRY